MREASYWVRKAKQNYNGTHLLLYFVDNFTFSFVIDLVILTFWFIYALTPKQIKETFNY